MKCKVTSFIDDPYIKELLREKDKEQNEMPSREHKKWTTFQRKFSISLEAWRNK